MLGLLSEAADQQPLLVRGRRRAVARRRIGRERSRSWLAACSRSGSRSRSRRVTCGSGVARFPQLRVDPLGRRDARALLESVLAARLDEPVLERIVAETGGNPLALLELPRGLTPAQLAGGFGLPAALPLSSGIEQSFTRRLGAASTRRAAVAAPGGGRAGRRPCASVARSAAARDPGDGRACAWSRKAC